MSSINNKIHGTGEYRALELPAANGSIKPGMLVLENSSKQAAVHATEGGFAEVLIVQEDALQGLTTADAYASGDPVQIAAERPGNLTLALLKSGLNYAVGDQLISDGAGRLKRAASVSSGVTVKQIIAVVVEAQNLTVSGATDTLTTVRTR